MVNAGDPDAVPSPGPRPRSGRRPEADGNPHKASPDCATIPPGVASRAYPLDETSPPGARIEQDGNPAGRNMTGFNFRFGALIAVLAISLAGCMPNEPANSYQAQYLANRTQCQPGMHAISRMRGSGYRCVYDEAGQ